MKKEKFRVLRAVAFFLSLFALLAGCTHVDAKGDVLRPQPASEKIEGFTVQEQFPLEAIVEDREIIITFLEPDEALEPHRRRSGETSR